VSWEPAELARKPALKRVIGNLLGSGRDGTLGEESREEEGVNNMKKSKKITARRLQKAVEGPKSCGEFASLKKEKKACQHKKAVKGTKETENEKWGGGKKTKKLFSDKRRMGRRGKGGGIGMNKMKKRNLA